jgi:hypothetical protein
VSVPVARPLGLFSYLKYVKFEKKLKCLLIGGACPYLRPLDTLKFKLKLKGLLSLRGAPLEAPLKTFLGASLATLERLFLGFLRGSFRDWLRDWLEAPLGALKAL